MEMRVCKKCNEPKELTTDFFNLLTSGTWRWTCKVCMAANTRRHYHENPAKVSARVARYNEQKRAAGGTYSAADISILRRRQNDRCAYCGESVQGFGEIDHMMPVSRGGTNSIENLILACRTCNRDKTNKTAAEFIAWRSRLGLKLNRRWKRRVADAES